MQPPIKIRPSQKTDEGFIFHSWLRTFQFSPFADSIRKPLYFENHHKLITRLLEDSDVQVAVNPEDSDQIYGYVVGQWFDSELAIHWAYVKSPFRGYKICSALVSGFLATGNKYFTHLNGFSEKIAPKLGFVYNPYIGIIHDKDAKSDKEEKPIFAVKPDDFKVATV